MYTSSGDFNRETKDATSIARVAFLTEFAISDYTEVDLSRAEVIWLPQPEDALSVTEWGA